MNFVRSSFFLVLLFGLSKVYPLTDTSAYQIIFDNPVDTSYISGESLYVKVSLQDQVYSYKAGGDLYLTVRAISGSGSGGSNTIVNQQIMVDGSDGSYLYPGIFIGALTAPLFELRIRTNADGNQRIEERRVLKHDTVAGSATSAWKLALMDLPAQVNGDSLIVVKAMVTSLAGSPLAGQVIMLSINDSTNQPLPGLGGEMTDIGGGQYVDTISPDVFINGHDYVFSVVTVNQPSIYSQRCVEILKKTVLPPVLVPVIPSTIVNLRPTLSWYKVEKAASYTIQIDTSSRFTTPMMTIPLSDTFYTPLVNLPMKTIYWRVSSSLSPLLYSLVGTFTIVDGNVPVVIPVLPDPTVERRPAMSWYKVNGAATYTVQVDTSISFSTPIFAVPTSDTSFVSAVDLPVRRIFWRVKSDLSATYSKVDTFVIQADTIPQLIRFNGDTLSERRPVFTWHKVARATAYTIQISHTRNFSMIHISTPLSDTVYSPLIDLDTSSRYFWRVSCDLNNAVYSSTDSFIIIVRTTGKECASGSNNMLFNAQPNPFSNTLVLTLDGAPYGSSVVFNVFDVKGRKVMSLKPVNNGGVFTALWEKRNSAGVYFVSAEVAGRVFKSKVMSIR